MSGPDISALLLTGWLALVTTLVLLIVGTPLAWWLARTSSRWRPAIEAMVALPLVLPPTVLGFYLLLLFNPTAPIGAAWLWLSGDTLTFSFAGLVVASCMYSLPFMVQPLTSAFTALSRGPVEAAASLRATPLDTFFSVVVPLSKRGFLTAAVLTFAHTLGEFGVVLMVGGNLPERTRVVSIAIYEHVETLAYTEAHTLSLILLLTSFVVLTVVYASNRSQAVRVG
ncbi:MAG: molybdate ABC transporter permease subunit [Pseudomonadota bacterium]